MGKPLRIVVMQRGHVSVGYVEEEGDQVVIYEARVVRRWGTSRGLGELAMGGPTAKTVLDPSGVERTHRLAVIKMIDCDEEKWRGR